MTKPFNNSQYLYTQDLNAAQWAWEFLRRNTDYQKDYLWFISLWNALEKDYGKVPDVDYQAWKQDPRSYKVIDIASEQDGNCAISDDKLLIECWMGYKWGFFQFPQSPKLKAIELEQIPNWRPLPVDFSVPDEPVKKKLTEQQFSNLTTSVDFDLTKPLKEQLERIKHHVIIAQRRLKKEGILKQFTVKGKKQFWMTCLKFIDVHVHLSTKEAEKFTQLLSEQFSSDEIDLMTSESDYYCQYYLNILNLMEK